MIRNAQHFIPALAVLLVVSVAIGCGKKDDGNTAKSGAATQPAAKPATPAEKPAEPAEKPAEPAEKPAEPAEKPAEPAEKPAEPAEKPAEPAEKPAEPAETPAEAAEQPAEAAEKPAEPADKPSEKAKAPTQAEVKSLCLRGCNKAQMCGFAHETVVTCQTKCLDAFAGDEDKPKRIYTARGECANRPCAQFMMCAQSRLLGQQAVEHAPPLEKAEATKRCQTLCDKERTCTPQVFAQRRRSMPQCLEACTLAMISTEKGAAVSRALLNKAWACAPKPCDQFEVCRHPANSATP